MSQPAELSSVSVTIPQVKLSSGATMPGIGLGTFGSDHVSAEQIAEAVHYAAGIGYRHFDCAAVYRNEKQVGDALQQVLRSGIARKDLWITSKLWNDKHDERDVIAAFEESLHDLQVDYLDLYLVHWPFPNYHPPGCDVTSRSPDATGYVHANYMKTWRKLEELVDRGLVKHIGTSNMTIPKLELVLRDARIRPEVNEMEMHPHFQQEELFRYVRQKGMVAVGYSPLGSPGRPERDRTPEDTSPTQDPVLLEIAKKHGISPASVCIAWAVQRGQVPIPFSVNPRNILANLQAASGNLLTEEEMERIAQVDRNCRLIKGQVFLWKDGQSWEDLWDVDGVVTPV